MMEYKRLTNQEWSENIDLTQELGYSYIYKRLHELEDKIEQGTLIEQKTCTYEQKKELDFIWWECSECGSGFNFYANTPYENRFHYCPYCGAKIIACKELQNG